MHKIYTDIYEIARDKDATPKQARERAIAALNDYMKAHRDAATEALAELGDGLRRMQEGLQPAKGDA